MCPVSITASDTTVDVELMVDTGSSVPILPKRIYEASFNSVPLQTPTARLVTYSRAPIPVLGCLPITLSRAAVTCSTKLFIVDSGTALLGMDLVKGQRLRFEGQHLLPSLPTTESEIFSQCYCFCCILNQINTGFVSRRVFFKKHKKSTDQKFFDW